MKRMRYSDFEGEFLRYLYRDSLRSDRQLDFREIAHRNEIPYERGYLRAIHGDLMRPGYIEGPPALVEGSPLFGRLTGHGLRYIEGRYKDDLPEGPSEWRDIRSELVEEADTSVIPASDRLVPLNHNSPEYQVVKAGIDELREAARSVNDLPDQDRILTSLAAAQTLWSSMELKVLQIKVGVMMAIEDAGMALASTAKTVATALMIDAVKSLVKSKTGIDLDHI
jgi:hypothetical protein